MTAYRAILKKYGGDAKAGMYNFVGYGLSKTFSEAVEQTGPDLPREKFIQTLESWKDYDTGWLGKVTYSPTYHNGIRTMLPVQVKGGKGVVLGPRRSPK